MPIEWRMTMREEMMDTGLPSERVARTMTAMVYDTYGSPEVLRIEEVDIPAPQDHEVLIEVHAASVNYGIGISSAANRS